MCLSPDMSVGNVIINKTLAASSVSTASLAAGKVLCSPFLFEGNDAVLFTAAGKGELVQVQLLETATATPIEGDIRLHFFAPNDAAISPGSVGMDFTVAAAPEKWIGYVDIVNADYVTAGAYAQATVFPKLHLFSGADNSKITVVAVTNGSIDYASGVALSLSLAVKQNV